MSAVDNSASALGAEADRTAGAAEKYIREHLFDPFGIMYSGIDLHTGKPFERDFITPVKVPRRAAFDPWSYWTYEDSIMSMGFYIDGLVRKFEITGEKACLEEAHKTWLIVRNIYYCSQVYGIGSFLRPYGGYDNMGKFAEPLGTDQAAPLFSGLYLYMKHAEGETTEEITDIMLKTLGWYEQQNWRYFYYKDMIHHWDVPFQHAASYYLPAIAWAWRVTGDGKWRKHLTEKLALFEQEGYNVYQSFHWSSDLGVLADAMGDEFAATFTPAVLEDGFRRCMAKVEEFNEPGFVKRMYPESAAACFRPYMKDDFEPSKRLGFRFFSCVHGGRVRIRDDFQSLCGLASVGHKEALGKALEIVKVFRNVPEDFTHFCAEDYDILPEEVHLYARSVGIYIVNWWRDYWLLRGLTRDQAPSCS